MKKRIKIKIKGYEKGIWYMNEATKNSEKVQYLNEQYNKVFNITNIEYTRNVFDGIIIEIK